MDQTLTRRLQEWLSAPASERDLRSGAEMLLRLSRNRILYQNILRRPQQMAAKLEYELRKHLRIRLDGLTIRQVVLMERTVLPRARESLAAGATEPPGGPAPTDGPAITTEADQPAPLHRGKRADHDRLPPEVQALWDENGDVWFKLRQTFETLKRMEAARPCDRYEYLKILKELDDKYRANLAAYDSYAATAAPAGGAETPQA